MNLTFLIVIFAFFLGIFRNTLFWVGLWQDKEYRLDRLLVHFRETEQGRKIFLSFGNIAKWFLLFLIILFLHLGRGKTNFYIFIFLTELTGLLFTVQAFFVLKDAFFHKIKRPVFTIKACIIVFITVLSTILFFWYIPFFSLLLIDRLIPFIIALLAGIFGIPSWFYKKYIIIKAKKKLKNFTKLKVIAVSGSYGKTSTKEYIAQVLSGKFKVVKTPGSNNTEIGVSRTILSTIENSTEFFVVEMGAYKIGEIRDLCKIVKPSISVTTAISDQHLSLYGSIENVISSEFELISAMDSNAISLFNAESAYMDNLFKKTNHKKIYYSLNKKKIVDGINAGNINVNTDGISFEVFLDKDHFSVTAPLLGKQAILNILPAIYIAKIFGLKIEEIKGAVNNLMPPPKTMVKIIIKNQSIGLDDTFNASPESVFAALEYLSLGKKKKYFVFAPLSELGKNAAYRHREIGQRIGDICDKVFVLNKNFSKDILEGIQESNSNCEVFFGGVKEVVELLSKVISKDDIVIFEGKEAGMVLRKLQ